MSDVPSNLIPTRLTQLPLAPVADENSLMMIVYQGNNYQIRVGDLLSVAGVPVTRQVIAGSGLTGGGQLSSNVTLSVAVNGITNQMLTNTGVTPGTYGTATEIPVLTVNEAGRVVAATTIPATISGYVPVTRQVIAGTGLTGGGALNANVTLDADLSNSTPLSTDGLGSAGVATTMSRSDHQHPSVNLQNANEIDGILGLSNGGTAKSIVPNAGAIIWCGADGLYVGPVGAAGEILQSNGTGEYLWVSQNTLDVGQADNLNGGAANRVVYQTASGVTGFISAPTVTDTFLRWDGSAIVWGSLPGGGTVTSVNASGGTTGMSFSGGPVTSSGTLTLSGTLTVANGGTGAVSLTGYVKGTGSSALTASSTIPNTDITGLGTMSTQNANNVTITGGAIDNAAVGATTPAAGTFTSVAMTTGTITTAPTNGTDIVNKDYADSIASGLNYHQPVNYASTTTLPAYTYNNGSSGVGATITANANGALSLGGGSPSAGQRVLVKDEAGGNAPYNGIYVVTQAGGLSAPFILTRATDYDTSGSGTNEIDAGDYVLVISGTNASTAWVQQTALPITVGTTALSFVQFNTPITYSAGTGLNLSPSTTFNISNTGVSSGSYGSASSVATFAVNAQGQLTSASDISISINGNQITSGTVGSSYLSGSYTGITGVGTLTTGTWNATTVSPGYGGTGLTSYAAGDVIYASGTTTLSKLTLGTTNYVLTAGASAPQYVAQSTLSVGSASTATTATTATYLAAGLANQIPYQTGAGTTSFITAPSVSSTYLQWNGTAFTWATAGTGTVTSITAGTYLTGGTITTSGTIAVDATSANTASKVVARDASGDFSAGTITATLSGSATTATNIAGGIASQIPYQTGAGATSFVANGTSGQMLKSGGTGAPSWANVDGGTF